MVMFIIFLSSISLLVLAVVLWIIVEVSIQVENLCSITLNIMCTATVKLCYLDYTCLSHVLGQKGGILQENNHEGLHQVQSQESQLIKSHENQVKKAMTATVIMRTGEIDFDGFDIKYSLIHTGTDAVLRTDQRNVDPSSVREANANITTAGGHVLKANCSGTLTAYVADTTFNMRMINIPDALIVNNLTENLTSQCSH
jgi:hypothetical protein